MLTPESRVAAIAVVFVLVLASGRPNGTDAEQLAQLLIGVLCACALLYFSYIELIHPEYMVSDRLFWTLVSLIVASVGLREFQYRYGGQSPPQRSTGDRRDNPRHGDRNTGERTGTGNGNERDQ